MPPATDKCGKHEEAIETLKKGQADQWAAIDHLRNRLPVWGTAVISLLTFALGFSLNHAVALVLAQVGAMLPP